MALLVFNIQPAAASDIRALDRHETLREKDGTSAIDPERRHLNRTLHGSELGPSASLEAFYKSGVNKPVGQAESPYLTVVLSASAEYFRPDDPEARGTWDSEPMEEWLVRSQAWLLAEFGDDLVHASLHLDEDTPHIHAVIAPTYEKKKRRPGKPKRGETPEKFEARCKAAETAGTTRTVGRASHPTLSQPGSFTYLRKSITAALSDLGIEYGEDRAPDAPDHMSTREWVAQQTVKLKKERELLASEKNALSMKERVLNKAEDDLDAREHQLDERDRQLDERSFQLSQREVRLNNRESRFNDRESRFIEVYNRVQDLISEVSEKLGIGKALKDIADAIKNYVSDEKELKKIDDDDPFEPS